MSRLPRILVNMFNVLLIGHTKPVSLKKIIKNLFGWSEMWLFCNNSFFMTVDLKQNTLWVRSAECQQLKYTDYQHRPISLRTDCVLESFCRETGTDRANHLPWCLKLSQLTAFGFQILKSMVWGQCWMLSANLYTSNLFNPVFSLENDL